MGSSSQSKPQEIKTFGTSKQLAQCRAAHLGPVVDNRLIAGTCTSRIRVKWPSYCPLASFGDHKNIAMNNPLFMVELSIQTFIHRGFLSQPRLRRPEGNWDAHPVGDNPQASLYLLMPTAVETSTNTVVFPFLHKTMKGARKGRDSILNRVLNALYNINKMKIRI